MQIIKRDSSSELLDLSKIHAVLDWAVHGSKDNGLGPIRGVSVSMIEMTAKLHFYNKMKTSEIHELLIKATADLISEDTPNYDIVAARLVWFAVRKSVFGTNIPPHLNTVIQKNIKNGFYSRDILDFYDNEEINELNSMMDHSRDDLFKYAGAEQMRKKYLVQNRKTKQLFESFQFPYIMVAALLFSKYPKETRMNWVKKFYDLASQHFISLPTPIMAGLRTKVKQFSSCTVIDVGDNLKSINASASAIVEYASRKAGIGLNIGRIRAQGQLVRNGDAVTTGIIPFAKYFNAALKSCCVTPDTIVEILENFVNRKKIKIKDLKPGMKIKSIDFITQEICFKNVDKVWDTIVEKEDQIRLYFSNGVVINCSINHPIMVFDNDLKIIEVLPLELVADDTVISDFGVCEFVKYETGQNNDTNYIDITVEDTHTFFAAESIESEMILTHNSQGAVRGASATFNFPGWHLEFESLIELKNNKGTEETRIRTVDYCIALNGTMYQRLVDGGNITLFSPDEVPDLYNAFYGPDLAKFEELYIKYENSSRVTKKTISAIDFFSKIMNERFETSRIYIFNADTVNYHTPFQDPIVQTNLCLVPETGIDVTINGKEARITIEEASELQLKDVDLKVLSKNIETGIISYNPITEIGLTGVNKEVFKITDEKTGCSITVTGNHPVWTKNRQWINAENLVETDELEII